MSLSYSDDNVGTKYGAGDLSAGSVSVDNGDLIIVHIGTFDDGTYPDDVTDSAGNTYSSIPTTSNSGGPLGQTWYCINATGDASNVITAEFSANDSSTRKNIAVAVYTPDSGDTVTLDDSVDNSSNWSSGPWDTGQLSTTGNDVVCQAFFQAYSGRVFSDQEIPSGSAANTLTGPSDTLEFFYQFFTSTQTNIEGEVSVPSATGFVAQMIAFKSEAGAGGGQVLQNAGMDGLGSFQFDSQLAGGLNG